MCGCRCLCGVKCRKINALLCRSGWRCTPPPGIGSVSGEDGAHPGRRYTPSSGKMAHMAERVLDNRFLLLLLRSE